MACRMICGSSGLLVITDKRLYYYTGSHLLQGEVKDLLGLAKASQIGSLKSSFEDVEGKDCIHSAAVSDSGQYIVTCDDFKQLIVWKSNLETQCLNQLSTRVLLRRSTAVCISRDESSVIVADKSGDVYRFSLLGKDEATFHTSDMESCQESEDSKTNLAAAGKAASVLVENKSCSGTLLLGHLSMLLDVKLICGDRFIATCDRDERIRISCYPNAYNIQSFCLGHTDFVRCMAYCSTNEVLFTCGADGYVCVWNPVDGKLLNKQEVKEPSSENPDPLILSGLSWHAQQGILNVSAERSATVHALQVLITTDADVSFGSKASLQLPGPVWEAAFCVRDQSSEVYVLGDFEDHVLKCFTLSLKKNELVFEELTKGSSWSAVVEINKLTDSLKDASLRRVNLSRLRKSKYDATEEYYKRKQKRLDAQK